MPVSACYSQKQQCDLETQSVDTVSLFYSVEQACNVAGQIANYLLAGKVAS